jgi:demethylmenaquinone methyltransferase / 2-methoxy-6-polyprenyl-1,4-benzoquinol methylase
MFAAMTDQPPDEPSDEPPGEHPGLPPGEPSTHFGYQEIPEAEKAGRVRGVFSSVATRYDLMNDLMSGGSHRLWKAALVDWLAPRPGIRLLDLAGGTGDVAFRVLDRVRGQGEATVCDMTEEMLAEGRARAAALGLSVDWVRGDAMRLPFAAGSFDAVTIAFGIRNVTRPEAALAECCRVLRPGGRFLCLEFGRPAVPAIQWLYDRYSFDVIPGLGQFVTGDRASYQYLVESIRRFPDAESFARMVADAGFGRARVRALSFGVVALTSGWRL